MKVYKLTIKSSFYDGEREDLTEKFCGVFSTNKDAQRNLDIIMSSDTFIDMVYVCDWVKPIIEEIELDGCYWKE